MPLIWMQQQQQHACKVKIITLRHATYASSFNKMLIVSLWAKIMQIMLGKWRKKGMNNHHQNSLYSASNPLQKKHISINDDLQPQLINFDIMMTYRLQGGRYNYYRTWWTQWTWTCCWQATCVRYICFTKPHEYTKRRERAINELKSKQRQGSPPVMWRS